MASVIYEAGVESGLPDGWLYLITARSEVNEMLALNQYIDLIIPRGSNEFVQYIMKNTTKIYNIKSYLLTALFNAGSTMSSYYKAMVNHDMPQFAG